jgi:phospholipid-transporting ATPase
VRKKVIITSRLGVCYIETKSLDGETNLKMKNVSSELLKDFPTDAEIPLRKIILKYEAPNPYLYRFFGEVID